MEKMENESRRLSRSKEVVPYPSRRMLAPAVPRPPLTELKLVAIAVEFNVRPRLADMPAVMQEKAFRTTRALVDAAPNDRPNPSHIARALKKEFDESYGPAWHCVAGKSFGSFVTHSPGGFLYFSADKLSFLLFKTEVRPVIESPSAP